METIQMPQLLIIAGTGRNTGKTTLACNIIRMANPLKSIIAIKITPHFHKNSISGKVLTNNANLYIAEETDSFTGKDSSLMLKAGATQSFFVMTTDDYLKEALPEILELIPSDTLIICESGGLRHHIIPGLFFIMKNSETAKLKPGAEKLLPLADRLITFDGEKRDFDLNSIEIIDNKWTLKQLYDDSF
jgi:hypothetical protein